MFEAIRERAGRHLYDLSSRRGLVPAFVLSAINNALNQEYHPLFFAMLARLFITNDNLRLAEASLVQAGEETHEVILVRGDLLAAQGDTRGARQLWEQLIADATTPQWIKGQAERKISESG
jgi:predicted negative regulator of RcsB-dependent stress response